MAGSTKGTKERMSDNRIRLEEYTTVFTLDEMGLLLQALKEFWCNHPAMEAEIFALSGRIQKELNEIDG
jgi:hypothetical protein